MATDTLLYDPHPTWYPASLYEQAQVWQDLNCLIIWHRRSGRDTGFEVWQQHFVDEPHVFITAIGDVSSS